MHTNITHQLDDMPENIGGMNNLIQMHLSVGDIIVEVLHPQTSRKLIGKVIHTQSSQAEDVIHLHILKKAGHFSHPPILCLNVHDYPLLAQSSMEKIIETTELLQVKRSNNIDIAFVLSIDLISNGTYHCIGISNNYFICFLSPPTVLLCFHQLLHMQAMR